MTHWKNLSIEDIQDEKWRPVTGYEDVYHISNFGRLKRLKTNRATHNNPAICVQQITKKGYLAVHVDKKLRSVHRIVAEAFIPNPENKPCVNHVFGEKQINTASRLEWVTHSENAIHALRVGLSKPTKGLTGLLNAKSKPVNQYDMNGVFIKRWESAELAAKGVSIHPSSITRCCNNKMNKSAGFKWKHA